MTHVSDISFDCPHCKGPLMADVSHIGMSCDCPHCYAQFQVPDASAVNKDHFVEPKGLRRILKQVRDQEWEMLRRKLRAAKAHNAELEAELIRVKAAHEDRATVAKPSDEKAAEADSLRKQIEELTEQFNQANQAFITGRKQQDAVIDHLRREMTAARDETAALKKKNEELSRLLQSAREMKAKAREEKSGELMSELERLRGELTETQNKLEAEQAKVLVMEAAGISSVLSGSELQPENDERLRELQAQVDELRKSNDSLRAARDKVHAELADLKGHRAKQDEENQHLETALGNLENGLAEVLELITARRAPAQNRA